jgi:tRNA threonylcarbamoyladenosine biosynthesis protein TsaE
MHFDINSFQDLDLLVIHILKEYPSIRVFLLNGNLGAGKTTIIQSFCKQLGILNTVSSPTFSIVNEYQLGDNKVYHMDLYRLNSIKEIYEIGLEEYLDSGLYCFIEWPDIAQNLYTMSHLKIDIELLPNQKRNINLQLL